MCLKNPGLPLAWRTVCDTLAVAWERPKTASANEDANNRQNIHEEAGLQTIHGSTDATYSVPIKCD
jgi:hypothetical protein